VPQLWPHLETTTKQKKGTMQPNIRQAILTSFVPCTDTKPARIKAECTRGKLFFPRDASDVTMQEAHIEAANALVRGFVAEDKKRYGTNKNPWSAPRWTGALSNGDYVHVFSHLE